VSDPEVGEPLSSDGTLPETSHPRLSEPGPALWGVPAEKSPPGLDAAEGAPKWVPPPWGVPAEEARLVGWAEWAASTTFSTSRLRVGHYDTAEVDAFQEAVRDTFLGVSRSPLT
jgi:hypothetical protein